MLARLTDVARQQGIGVFECQMLAENQPMMKMLARSGFVMEQRLEAGFFQVTLRINA
jgi:RimJ/RimL family protein N-acetyltransferase